MDVVVLSPGSIICDTQQHHGRSAIGSTLGRLGLGRALRAAAEAWGIVLNGTQRR
jgi:hypothetical protein